jgi:pseudouridine-5'-phosphate glycosidase
MICAEMAGIDVFATGGIGGVHRGGENSFDISADLYELSRTPVAVVCAGAKSILDIGRTLEVLETLGVPVIGYQTSQFPAFFSRTSEFPVDYRFDQVPQMARLIRCQKELGLKGGVLIANPVPIESEIPAQEIEKQIEEALREADRKGIHGKEVTPFLLSAVVEKTQGRSLKTNIALIQNNARLAAKLAREMRI